MLSLYTIHIQYILYVVTAYYTLLLYTIRCYCIRRESKPPLSKEQAEVWTKPFQEPDELVKTARELHDGVTDPKLKNSKVGIKCDEL